jgi:hypothetical protein
MGRGVGRKEKKRIIALDTDDDTRAWWNGSFYYILDQNLIGEVGSHLLKTPCSHSQWNGILT